MLFIIVLKMFVDWINHLLSPSHIQTVRRLIWIFVTVYGLVKFQRIPLAVTIAWRQRGRVV